MWVGSGRSSRSRIVWVMDYLVSCLGASRNQPDSTLLPWPGSEMSVSNLSVCLTLIGMIHRPTLILLSQTNEFEHLPLRSFFGLMKLMLERCQSLQHGN
jgi:hypothetical protein